MQLKYGQVVKYSYTCRYYRAIEYNTLLILVVRHDMSIPFINDSDLLSKESLRDALRLGLQSSIAAAATYAIMQTLSLSELFVGVLSAVLVIEKSMGESLGASGQRFLATIAGCVIGGVCLYLVPGGYSVVAGLTISMFVMNFVAGLKPAWRYGVVATVAMSINTSENIWDVATQRTIAIGLGVVIGSLVTVVVWPDKASTRAQRHVNIVLSLIAEYINESVSHSVDENDSNDDSTTEKLEELSNDYTTHISAARTLASNMKFGDDKSSIICNIEAAERIENCGRVMRSLSDTTSDMHGGSEAVKEALSNVKEKLTDALHKASKQEKIDKYTFEDLQTNLDIISDKLATDHEDEKYRMLVGAFTFAVTQALKSLQTINDKLDEQ